MIVPVSAYKNNKLQALFLSFLFFFFLFFFGYYFILNTDVWGGKHHSNVSRDTRDILYNKHTYIFMVAILSSSLSLADSEKPSEWIQEFLRFSVWLILFVSLLVRFADKDNSPE